MRTYRLPSGKETASVDEYANAWGAMGKALERAFHGYTFVSCNPGFTLEARVVDKATNTYSVNDRFTLSVEAATILLKRMKIHF